MLKIGPWHLFLAAALLAESATGPEKPVLPGREASHAAVWQVQASGTDVGLRGLSTVSRDVAWSSGEHGTFLRTTDGGSHWQVGRVPGAENLDFRDIQAFDARHACVLSAGRPAKFYRTADGGQTWTETYSNDSQGIFFDAFAFFDEKRGIAVGDPVEKRFMIVTTDDGGRTWEEVSAEGRPQALEGETAFAASGTCLTVWGKDRAWFCTGGPSPRVFYSKDGGRRWKTVPSPLDLGRPSSGGFSLVFLDRNNGVMVGGDYEDETGTLKNAAFSGNGGRSWHSVGEDPPSGFRECVAFVHNTNPQIIIAAGPSGSDISVDGGKTWRMIPGPGFHSLSFSQKDGAGWAVGRKGLIARFCLKAAQSLLKE